MVSWSFYWSTSIASLCSWLLHELYSFCWRLSNRSIMRTLNSRSSAPLNCSLLDLFSAELEMGYLFLFPRLFLLSLYSKSWLFGAFEEICWFPSRISINLTKPATDQDGTLHLITLDWTNWALTWTASSPTPNWQLILPYKLWSTMPGLLMQINSFCPPVVKSHSGEKSTMSNWILLESKVYGVVFPFGLRSYSLWRLCMMFCSICF